VVTRLHEILQLAPGAVIAAPQNRSVSVATLISSHRPDGMHVHYGATGELLCCPCGPWFPCSVNALAGRRLLLQSVQAAERTATTEEYKHC